MAQTRSPSLSYLLLIPLALGGCRDLGPAPDPIFHDGAITSVDDGGDSDLALPEGAPPDLAGTRPADLFGAPDYAMARPAASPAAWYRFEDVTGPVVDSSPNHNDGAIGGQGYGRGVPGRFGSALSFAGQSAYVRVPATPSLDMQTGGTIEFWLKLGNVAQGTINSEVSRGTGDGDDNILINSDCGNVQGQFSLAISGGDAATSACNAVVAQTWTHIAVSNDGQTIRLYVNAMLIAESGGDGGYLGPMAADLYFGQREGGLFPLTGALDELKWWTVLRAQSDICTDGGGQWTGQQCTYP